MEKSKGKIHKPDSSHPIYTAANALISGKLVAFPTETVYGLGANALDDNAVKKIYQVKGRPGDNPLIVHVANKGRILPLVKELTLPAKAIMDRFMPGPITLVCKKSSLVPDETTAGLDTVAVRMPSHPVALFFLEIVNLPVAAPSANISGKPSPTSLKHVLNDLGGRIGYIIDGGYCDVGVESTVVDVTGDKPVILRPGYITKRQINDALAELKDSPRPADIKSCIEEENYNDLHPPRSPGTKYRHYAPEAKIIMLFDEKMDIRISHAQKHIANALGKGNKVGVYSSEEFKDALKNSFPDLEYITFGVRKDIKSALSLLYYALRKMDESGVDIILAETFSGEGLETAYMNRLMKAAGEES